MRSHRQTSEHQEAVSRRLALLSAELTAVRQADGLTGEESVDPWAPPATHTRVRTDRWSTHSPPALAEPPPDRPPLVPEPGRHARRHGGAPLLEAHAERWRGRLVLGSGHLAWVAVAVALAFALTCWWLVRDTPTDVVAPGQGGRAPAASAPLVTPSATPELAGLPASPPASAGHELVVDVAGKVRRPGIAVLEPGSRVLDAIEAAGGARSGVDLAALNLARPLVDGEQVLVGISPAAGAVAGLVSTPTAAVDGPGALVSLNAADQAALETLPEVGPVTAQAIIGWREEHGGFTSVDELLEVDGIGDATLEQLAPLVTL